MVESALERCVLLIRHGEGYHNVNRWNGNDPPLTENGKGQARALRSSHKLQEHRPEVLICSPLLRAVQTAALVFGEQPRFRTIITPLHSERWSGPCDQGSTKSELLAACPFVKSWEGFEELPEEWSPTSRESDRNWVQERVPRFLDFVRRQTERRIVIVGHGAFFNALVGFHMKNCECVELRPGMTRNVHRPV